VVESGQNAEKGVGSTKGYSNFLEVKEASVYFQEVMAKSEFKCYFAFAVDLMEKLNELNGTLQGKNVFAHEMYNAVKSFTIKSNLLSYQLEEGNLIHFPVLKSIAVDNKLNKKYSRQLDSLKNEFERRFSDFKTLEKEFKLVTAPFSFDYAKAPNDCQMELIDMQCDLTLKETFLSFQRVHQRSLWPQRLFWWTL